MKNLIEKIEKIIVSLKRQYQNCFEEIDCPLFTSDEIKGKILAYQDCVNLLNQYNIITAPKSIKLSEIMNKLNLAFPKIAREEKVIRIYNGKALILNIFDNHLQPINVQPYSETKWLYTLWIAGTEIIDDLECDE